METVLLALLIDQGSEVSKSTPLPRTSGQRPLPHLPTSREKEEANKHLEEIKRELAEERKRAEERERERQQENTRLAEALEVANKQLAEHAGTALWFYCNHVASISAVMLTLVV